MEDKYELLTQEGAEILIFNYLGLTVQKTVTQLLTV